MVCAPYRTWLKPDDPRHAHLREATAISHAEHLFSNVPFVTELNKYWDRLWREPFRGVTNDGER
jgi:hypothetical protein